MNGNRLDNRAANLREATRAQNAANAPVRRDSRSGVKGVRQDGRTGKWIASIKAGGHAKHLGVFESVEAAAAAYRAAAQRLHGRFARPA